MSRHIDSRKNRSYSTTENSRFFILPPLALRWEPPRQRSQQCHGPGRKFLICVKHATGATPWLHKLWLRSEREVAQLEAALARLQRIPRPAVNGAAPTITSIQADR